MKKERYTTITEFEVIEPTNDIETIGEKIKLSAFGEYCPDGSLRGYSLLHLLDHQLHYRVSKIIMQGNEYEIPLGREQNWYPKIHPELKKFYKGDCYEKPINQ